MTDLDWLSLQCWVCEVVVKQEGKLSVIHNDVNVCSEHSLDQ